MLADSTTYTPAHLQASSHLTPKGGSDKNLWHEGYEGSFEHYESVINNAVLSSKIYLQASTALADSGASDILLRQSDTANIFQDKTVQNIDVILPNNQSLRSIAAGLLWLPHLFTSLRVYILRDTDLRRSLFGLAPLCAQGCHVSFTNTTATVSHDGNINERIRLILFICIYLIFYF